MINEAFDGWAALRRQWATGGSEIIWPSETLVRIVKGDYVPGLDKNYADKKVLEVGCGMGNNLVFLGSLGLSLCATEVREEICQIAKDYVAKTGYEVDARVGTNRALPFQDDEFDFLVSWNVVHYEDSERGMREAIAEYCRVLKPGGRLFVSTAGPKDMIMKNSSTLGGHRYRIGRDDDWRKGQVFFCFDAPSYVNFYFSERFSDVMVGRTYDFLFTETVDCFIVTGVKE